MTGQLTFHLRPREHRNPRLRPLGITWLAAAAAVAVPAYMLTAVSDHPDDRTPGVILTVLVATGVGLGGWLLTSPTRSARLASLLGSAAWLLAAVLVYPTQDFTADALWAAGVPALAAVVTALLAWAAGRSGR